MLAIPDRTATARRGGGEDGHRYRTHEHPAAGSARPRSDYYAWAAEHEAHCIGSAELRLDVDQHCATYTVGVFMAASRSRGWADLSSGPKRAAGLRGHRRRHRAPRPGTRAPDTEVTRKGGKIATIPLATRHARAIDLAISERTGRPLFLGTDGRRLPAGAGSFGQSGGHSARGPPAGSVMPGLSRLADRLRHGGRSLVLARSCRWLPGSRRAAGSAAVPCGKGCDSGGRASSGRARN